MTGTPREPPPQVADDSLRDLGTPALLRQIAGVPAPADAAGQVTLEASVLHPELVPNGFVLVDFDPACCVRV